MNWIKRLFDCSCRQCYNWRKRIFGFDGKIWL